MDIIVHPTKILHQGLLICGGRKYLCAVGRGGIAEKKREGDGITPLGIWPIRYGFYREDRVTKPECALPFIPLSQEFGWCDESSDPHYNRLIKCPYTTSHETLWREDHLYNLVLVLGYNDDPVVSGKGSAIFMHLAREGHTPTAGCIALSEEDFREVLSRLTPHSRVAVRMESSSPSSLG